MNLHNECDALQRIPVFAGVDMAKLKLIAITSRRLAFQPGDVVFKEGSVSDSVFIMLDGTVQLEKASPHGPEVVAQLSGGALFGEIGVICNVARTVSVVAATPSIILRIEADVFVDLLHQLPQVTLAVARELGFRLSQANDRLIAREQEAGLYRG